MSKTFNDLIERQEAQGQRDFVNSILLPTNPGFPKYGQTKEDLEQAYIDMGIVFGPVVSTDPIFRHATLPRGWKKVPSDHSMWSYIEDERGIKRIGIFYKAAFYDRSAHMDLIDVAIHFVAQAFHTGPSCVDDIPWDILTSEERNDIWNYLRKRQVVYKKDVETTEQPYYNGYKNTPGQHKQAKTYLSNITDTMDELTHRNWLPD